MRFRQVHLDFHTSEHIEDIGKKFNKKQFQTALKKGHINSITLFSKCHHGWAYHPSKANEIHPHLDFDLLGAQIQAAHEIGVKTPIYLSAGLDEKMAHRHPEWLVRNLDESTTWAKDFTEPGYHFRYVHRNGSSCNYGGRHDDGNYHKRYRPFNRLDNGVGCNGRRNDT